MLYLNMASFSLPLLLSLILYRLHQKYYKVLPKVRVWKFELFPSLKITIKGKIIHLHHWPSFLIILTISLFVEGGLLSSSVFKGILTGGLIQGVLDPTPPTSWVRNKLVTFSKWYRLPGGKER